MIARGRFLTGPKRTQQTLSFSLSIFLYLSLSVPGAQPNGIIFFTGTGNGPYISAADGTNGNGSASNGACSESRRSPSHSLHRPVPVPILPQPSVAMSQAPMSAGDVLSVTERKPPEVPGECSIIILFLSSSSLLLFFFLFFFFFFFFFSSSSSSSSSSLSVSALM